MVERFSKAGIVVLERGWLSSNSVILKGDDSRGAVLVDTGYWTHSEQTVALVRSSLGGDPLTRVLNTHLHSDHCGGNAAIAAAFGCPIDVPAGEAQTVDAWDEDALTYKATGQHCPRFTRAGLIDAPSELHAGRWAWQTIATPGHDPKSIALYQPELKVLISADALWENGFGVVFPELEGDAAFNDVEDTLDLLSTLNVDWAIPGHGRPFSDAAGAIGRARRRLESFRRDPRTHALHAAKVLVKFRLLETREEKWDDFLCWFKNTRYFDMVASRYFPNRPVMEWLFQIISDMSARGALTFENGLLQNRD